MAGDDRSGSGVRIGVLGGTFDPIHVGHLAAAVALRHALGPGARVLVVVARDPWQKAGRTDLAPAEDRFDMVAAAVADLSGIEPSRVELDRPGPTYTADTLAALHGDHAGAELVLAVGADVAASMHTWHRPEEVRRLARLAVLTRPGSPVPPVASEPGVLVVDVPALDVSSTDLRDRARDGRPLEVLVPAPALHLLRARGLYSRP